MDADTGELPAIKATRSKSSMDALPFLGRALGARTNKPASVVEGAAVLPRDVRGRERG
jgi:hypothetical protein